MATTKADTGARRRVNPGTIKAKSAKPVVQPIQPIFTVELEGAGVTPRFYRFIPWDDSIGEYHAGMWYFDKRTLPINGDILVNFVGFSKWGNYLKYQEVEGDGAMTIGPFFFNRDYFKGADSISTTLRVVFTINGPNRGELAVYLPNR